MFGLVPRDIDVSPWTFTIPFNQILYLLIALIGLDAGLPVGLGESDSLIGTA